MRLIHCLNNISAQGTDLLDPKAYSLTDSLDEAEGILVRSAAMHDMKFPAGLRAIARAGAGVNNIPLDRCADEGIVVFNTPGANANAVKEIVLCALLLGSRDILGGIKWCRENADDENITKAAEKAKKKFAGQEIKGKKLGVIGDYTGALGIMTITPSEGAIIGADVAMKAANVEVVFVDRFNGSLIINGTVADVEAAVKDVLNVLENTLHFAPTVITKS